MESLSSKNSNIRLVQSKKDCGHCDVEHLCIGDGINDKYAHKLNKIVKQGDCYDPGQLIYKRGDKFTSVYVIQQGMAKSETSNIDGRPQVTGFYFPGDLIGLDAVSQDVLPCDLVAIEKTWLCEIPFYKLEKLCSVDSGLQHELFMRMGQRIHHDEYHCLAVRNDAADKRILGFITELFQKLVGSDYITDNYLQLPMIKVDISSYLGLQPETFSRSMKRLQEQGYLINTTKHIEIMDLDRIIKVIEN